MPRVRNWPHAWPSRLKGLPSFSFSEVEEDSNLVLAEPSQDSPTQPSASRIQINNFGFTFGDTLKERDQMNKTSDPIEKSLEQVREATSMPELYIPSKCAYGSNSQHAYHTRRTRPTSSTLSRSTKRRLPTNPMNVQTPPR